MAEENKPSLFDQLLTYGDRLGTVYQKVKLADKGVATNPTAAYETNGANSPLVQQGQPANVSGNDPLAQAINNVTNKAALAYSAKQFSDSMPYIVGGLAFAVAIYLIIKK
jgi:hypothetical protein